jgi:serine/threonine protein phosphatase PrpC
VGLKAGIEAAARSDIGLVRHSNQDSFASNDELGVFVVCDGMGGAAGGEVASKLAAETFVAIARQEIESDAADAVGTTERALRRAAAAANRAVCAKADFDTRLRGMGTTLVAARLEQGTLTVLNVGDSRAYLLRRDVMRQISVDHSYLAEQVQLGLMTEEEAEISPLQSVITRAIGAEPDVNPDVFHDTVIAGDIVLLASDGLTRHLENGEIASVLQAAAIDGCDTVCGELIELAKEAGGSDNITCWVIRVKKQR